ncbi:protein phosphatase 1 regulatory subunit 3G [Hypomesus transpacificus]|uniref:protein phosphatase 1 regulatory subunit 3G n=1 Tax=Hypomesus transpacificus TaxID=137520 RepID=UPI001F087D51|nr:protein phosphatase 1 regulatory subunit 3G [Hypomesus transpacificus]
MSESTLRHSTQLAVQPSEGAMLSVSSEEPAENGEDLKDLSETEACELYVKDRRRAKSLPAYPDQATLFEDIANNGRKRVKFADSMGLDLASVKHFSTAEDPMIPSKVLSRLQSFPPQQERELLGDLCSNFKSALTMDRFVPTFKMPAEAVDFEARVLQRHVTLEKITITQFDVRGHIRTDTHSSSKRDVGVRYTFNNWLSLVDAQAMVVTGEETGMVGERFTFMMYTPPFLDPSSSVHFAVYLRNDQGEFWDNNDGQNYTLKYNCVPTCDSAVFHAT